MGLLQGYPSGGCLKTVSKWSFIATHTPTVKRFFDKETCHFYAIQIFITSLHNEFSSLYKYEPFHENYSTLTYMGVKKWGFEKSHIFLNFGDFENCLHFLNVKCLRPLDKMSVAPKPHKITLKFFLRLVTHLIWWKVNKNTNHQTIPNIPTEIPAEGGHFVPPTRP